MADKILFLDIDGVLNSERFHRALVSDNFPYGMEIDPTSMALLKSFLDANSTVKIVISSSWRDTLSLTQFNELFATYDICNKIIDLTSNDVTKSASIELWLKHNKPYKFAIIDDDQLFDIGHRLHKYQVKTSMGVGLQKKHLVDIEELFTD